MRGQQAPTLLFDLATSTLIDANAAGAALWFGRAPQAFPVVLDRAMPAWATLRAPGHAGQAGVLCLWTAVGITRCRGQVFPLGDERHVAVVCDAPQHVASEPPAVAPAAETECASGRHARNAKLAHELRTPIGAVAAYAEVLAGEHFGPLGNERYRVYARNMRDGALHALAVIDGMMGLSREESGSRRELRFRDVDPGEVARNCLSVIRPIADAAEVRVEACVPEDLPLIIADEVSLRQMLLNLLTNAVKFARPSDRVTLAVSYEADGSLTFAVDDTGPGLDATRRPDEPNGKGLGLGLPLTRELAAANGAALAIESEPGQGTRARISFGHTRVVV
jgi:signal transduction histidine kinase